MSVIKRSTLAPVSVPGNLRRHQSHLDWNVPHKAAGTHPREYAFMRHYGMAWMRPSTGGFEPGNSEVRQ
jgi:hypothetical protein